MNVYLKMLLTVFPICLFLSGGVGLFLFFFFSEFGSMEIVWTVFAVVWTFYLLPALIFAMEFIKNSNVTAKYAFWIGFVFGDLIVFLLVLCAPISGTIWFADTLCRHVRFLKEKRKKTRSEEEGDNIFYM